MNLAKGIWFCALAYFTWGFFPIFWKLLTEVPPAELLAHRVLYSFICLLPLLAAKRYRDQISGLLAENRPQLRKLAIRSFLIGLNWYTFLVCMVTHRVMESSLGYFLAPLFSILLGTLLLGESLNVPRGIAMGLASVGLLFLCSQLDSPPLLAIGLALSFSLYGYYKTQIKLNGALCLLVEMALLSPIAVGYLVLHGHAFTPRIWMFLFLSGPLTVLPLIWYASAIQYMAFSIVGFLQYLTPALHFVLAIWLYGEYFGPAHKTAFALVWLALGVFTFDLFRQLRPKRAHSPAVALAKG